MNPIVTWKIEVKTSAAPASGIKASSSVFVKIYGETGVIQPIQLEGRGEEISKFGQDTRSEFRIDRDDVGNVRAIDVWHTDENDWGMDSIKIQSGNNEWTFTLKGGQRTIPATKSVDASAGPPRPLRLEGEHAFVSSGANRLHTAAKRNEAPPIEVMLQNNEFSVDQTDKVGRTASMYACMYGGKDALRTLVEFNADLLRTDNYGRTLLHYACMNKKNNIEIVRLLLDEKYVPAVALEHGAAEDDEMKAADEIPRRRMRFIRMQDKYGRGAMHYAASYGFKDVIQMLNEHCHLALSDKDSMGFTPLHCAAVQGQADVTRTLITLGVGSNVTAKNNDDKNFLHLSAAAGHVEFIRDIFGTVYGSFTANTQKNLQSLVEAPDKAGRTPLLVAACNGHLEVVQLLVTGLKAVRADMFHEDSDKSNILHLSARKAGDRLLEYCVQKQDINSLNYYKFTPLHVAAESNNEAAVQWLIKHGADIYAKNIAGQTALDIARERKYENISRALENADEYLKVLKQTSSSGLEGSSGQTNTTEPTPAVDDHMSQLPLSMNGYEKKPAPRPKEISPEVQLLQKENERLQAELRELRLQALQISSSLAPSPTP